MMKPRISLFAEQEREDRRAKLGDPLVGLAEHVDFEALAARIDVAAPRPSRAKGGRPPIHLDIQWNLAGDGNSKLD